MFSNIIILISIIIIGYVSATELRCENKSSSKLICLLNFYQQNDEIIINETDAGVLASVNEIGFKNSTLFDIPNKIFLNLENLEILDVSHTLLKTLTNHSLERTHQLKRFLASNNKLEKLVAQTFINNSNLIEIDLSQNQIKEIDILTFQGLDKLRILNLNNNHINELPVYLLYNLTSLESFQIARNRITELQNYVFQTNPYIKNVSLAQNNIHKINYLLFANIRSTIFDFRGNECIDTILNFTEHTADDSWMKLEICHSNFYPRNPLNFKPRENPLRKDNIDFIGLIFLAGVAGFALLSLRCCGK